MIRINLNVNEDKIVDEFYRKVVPKDSNKESPLSVITKEREKESTIVSSELLDDLEKDINGEISIDAATPLSSIIIAKPNQLRQYIDYFEKIYFEDTSSPNLSEIKKTIRSIFYYDKYSKWDAYSLANSYSDLGRIKVCPYCNRNYISVLGLQNSKNGKTRMRFDHYYDKARYPYLALSFYNLIPCCTVCNSDLKGSKNFLEKPHIHPFEWDTEDSKFKLDIQDVTFINAEPKTYNIKLDYQKTVDHKKQQKIKNHNETFKIEKLYNFHKDITDDIIRKFYVYNDDMIESIIATFEGKLISSPNEVRMMVFGSLEVDNSKPFSKLTQDIIEDIKGKKIVKNNVYS